MKLYFTRNEIKELDFAFEILDKTKAIEIYSDEDRDFELYELNTISGSESLIETVEDIDDIEESDVSILLVREVPLERLLRYFYNKEWEDHEITKDLPVIFDKLINNDYV